MFIIVHFIKKVKLLWEFRYNNSLKVVGVINEVVGGVIDEVVRGVIDEVVGGVIDEIVVGVIDELVFSVIDEVVGGVIDEIVGGVINEIVVGTSALVWVQLIEPPRSIYHRSTKRIMNKNLYDLLNPPMLENWGDVEDGVSIEGTSSITASWSEVSVSLFDEDRPSNFSLVTALGSKG
jgi:hypothetical protein